MHITRRIDICQLLWIYFVETSFKAVKCLCRGCIIKRALLSNVLMRNMETDAKVAHSTMIAEKKVHHVYCLAIEILWQKERLI